MLDFLTHAKQGIDMNLITYRRPTHVYRSDSCPAGLGGYSHAGFAWRYPLPPPLAIQSVEQPPRTHCGNRHPLGGHHRRQTSTGGLRIIDDG